MKYRVKVKKLGRWPKTAILLAISAVILTVGAIGISSHIYHNNLMPLNSSSQKSLSVNIPTGSSLKEVAKILKTQNIIRSEWAFTQYVRDKNASDALKAGTYDLSPSQSVPEIVSIITDGKIAANLITILPGQRLDQIKKMFVSSGFSQTSVDQAFNPDLYKDHPALVDKPAGASLEGYLYPESFQKTSNTLPQDIIRQSLDEMQKRLTPELRAALVAQNLTVHQGIILASIVEQEADKPQDRQQIAQVFLSRLRDGMVLGSDVTAFYGAVINGQPPSVNYDSAYNTRLHPGLPPGPISNVSDSSLNAVAHPADTNYLYFVAGDDGTVYYSATAAEHDAQVSQYCHKLCN